MTLRPAAISGVFALVASSLAAVLPMPARAATHEGPRDGAPTQEPGQPGCLQVDARACVEQALAAMGGRDRLAGIRAVRYQSASHTVLAEQSYRQQPFLTAYGREVLTLDFEHRRFASAAHLIWPESDPKEFESDRAVVVTPAGGVTRSAGADAPCSPADLDRADDLLALGPERLLLTASAATDLHYVPAQWLRSTPHAAVAFTWHGIATTVLLNGINHLPDALTRVRTFQDFWHAWGDVHQLVYFDNWHLVDGILLPTNRVEVRNGIAWQSTQALGIDLDVTLDESQFALDAGAAAKSRLSPGWERSFGAGNPVVLAPGVLLYPGAWNTTLIRQADGVLLLEAPVSPGYTRGALAQARRAFPGAAIQGVLSTSDSWPHVAGVREAVAEGIPVYALELNLPELNALVAAPHALHPDGLQDAPATPRWRSVGDGLELGSGENRVVLYPIGGPSTERQYMVYFPQHRLLYASDTLAINPDHTLYDPQLMHEVVQAVERHRLAVDTVYAMHEGPTAWKDVVHRVRQASERAPGSR